MIIEHYHEQSFTWDSWSGGNLTEMLNIPNRKEIILDNIDIIRKHAIGWCISDDVVCRPKKGKVSVMFEVAATLCFTSLKLLFYLTF